MEILQPLDENAPVGVDPEKASLYTRVFNNPDGRKVLIDLLHFSEYHGDPYRDSPFATSYNLGKRRIVNRIIRFLGYHNIESDVSMVGELLEEENGKR